MPTALEGGEGSASRPGRSLTPGKTRYPFYARLSGPQGRSGLAKNLAPPGFDPSTAQPVAQSLYRLSYPAHTALYTSVINQPMHTYTTNMFNHILLFFRNVFRPLLWTSAYKYFSITSNLNTVVYARTNVIGFRTSFVIASVPSSIYWNICI